MRIWRKLPKNHREKYSAAKIRLPEIEPFDFEQSYNYIAEISLTT